MTLAILNARQKQATIRIAYYTANDSDAQEKGFNWTIDMKYPVIVLAPLHRSYNLSLLIRQTSTQINE
jgi:hypothetical protein